MDFFSLGSEISYPDYNAIVYLLRKFKRLTSDLKLGSSRIESDYGSYNVAGGLTSVGGNFILEDDVTITSSDVLLNCFYTFYFTVVDVNLSGTVNKRVVSVTGDTGDNGILEVVLEPSLLESDEVILPDFKVDIVFDEHEYYTPVSSLDITLEVDKRYVTSGETATVTVTVLDSDGDAVVGLTVGFDVNGTVSSDTTDSDGVASVSYTGTGAGWVNVNVMGRTIKFYDGEVMIANVVAGIINKSVTLGRTSQWLSTNGEVTIDWGDGTTSTVNNPDIQLTHNYTDGVSSHDIKFIGEVTSIGRYCFFKCFSLTSIVIPDSVVSLGDQCFQECSNLTSVVIPDSVVSLGYACFNYCTSLTSVTIPDSVTSIGNECFSLCDALVDYQLYWTGNDIITYGSNKMPNNANTVFTIPYEETSNYTAKNYPSSKLRERGLNLELTSDKPIIQSSETSTITATLTHETTPLTSKTLSYQIKHGSTVISTGTKTTNSSGQATISYTGTGIGDVDVIVSYGSLLQETYELKDVFFYDNARTGQKNSNWTKSSDQLTVTTADDGTTVSATSNNEYLTNTGLTGDFKATLKTYVTGGAVRIALKDGNGNYTRVVSVTTDRTIYYEITRINDVYRVKYSYDNVTWVSMNFEQNNAIGTVKFGIVINVSSGTRAMKYSDLIIEPI